MGGFCPKIASEKEKLRAVRFRRTATDLREPWKSGRTHLEPGRHKIGMEEQHSKNPDGRPVEASGIWIDNDMPLSIGSRVLAFTRNEWYRGIIIGVKSNDYFVVRFIGWEPFWDEIHERNRLQVDPCERPRTVRNTNSVDSIQNARE